jgi:GNAT superfamily N-acetyltransferase
MSAETVPQRIATANDADAIAALMRASVLAIFPDYYDDRQTASSAIHIAHVDEALLADGTYFVHEADGELVACGGWSRRGRLYMGSGDQAGDDRLLDPGTDAAHVRAMFVRGDWTRRGLGRAILESSRAAAQEEGFQMLDLMATLPGVPLYRSFGFRDIAPAVLTMPDGVSIDAIAMDRRISS